MTSRAAVPFVTAMPCLAEWNFANSCSKARVRVPGVRHQIRLSRTSVSALRSASSYCGQTGNGFCLDFLPPLQCKFRHDDLLTWLRRLKLIEAGCVTEGFDVVAIFARLFGAEFLLGLGIVLEVPVGTIFVDGRLELANLL